MAQQQSLEKIAEEYYQISSNILSSFPKYRPPLDLFVYKESIRQLVHFAKKGDRLSNEQVEEMHRLCGEGDLFVSRADHPIYSQHIVKQLDLILVDDNIKPGEAADICIQALQLRLQDFFEQPVRPVYEQLYENAMVVTEFIWTDKHRLKNFLRRMHTRDHSLAAHSVNTLSLGLWLLLQTRKDEVSRKEFDQAALALLLHDTGMSKVPAFITAKTTQLKVEERDKITPHPLLGHKIALKLDLPFDAMRQATLEHHERLDGSGYPQKTKNISTFGKLTAVADAFSAMIQKRPYAPAKAPLDAAKELAAARTQFDLTYSGALLSALLSNSITMG